MQPNFFSKLRRTSTGMRRAAGDAQCAATRCPASASAWWCSIAAYIVGTPSKIVTWSRSMICRALPGSNLGSRVSVPPPATVAFSPQVSPKTWNSGRQPIITSSGPAVEQGRAVSVALRASPAWVSWAPFGRPVVPEV